jgi:prefoldin alpha subunit
MPKEIKLSFEQLVQLYDEQKRQLSSFEQIKATLQNNLVEVLSAREALNEIQKSSKDANILLNVGANTFIKAKVSSITEAIVVLGSNTAKNMTFKKALLKLEEKKAELEKNLKQLQAEESKLYQNILGIEKIFREIQEQQKNVSPKTPKESDSTSTPIIS